MHKKTKTRSVSLKEKVKHPRPDTMTIFVPPEDPRNRLDRRILVLENAPSRNRKEIDKNHGNRSPTPDVNDSWSWERRGSSDTSVSWPEEMEGATTAKVMDQWEAVQRTLYGEEDQVTSEIARAECIQWRDQKPRLRVVGKGLSLRGNDEVEEASTSVLAKASESSPIVEEIIAEDTLAENADEDSSRRKARDARRDEVLKIIVDFVCASVTRKISEDANVFGEQLDEVLKVTPAPTYSARNYSRNGRLTPKVAGGDAKTRFENRDDENKNHSEILAALPGVRDVDDVRPTMLVGNRVLRNDAASEKNRTCSRRSARNIPGTIFSEKIIVGPVPFSTSTKESFSTLKSTPLGLGRLKPTVESSLLQRSTKSVNVRFRGGALERRTDLVRMPHVQSAWQGPVCPTIWPKNIKLAPIDAASLPVGHQRPLAKSVVQPRRSRNSLSPIPRDIMPLSFREPSLEIEGKRICNKKIATSVSDNPELPLGTPRVIEAEEAGNRK